MSTSNDYVKETAHVIKQRYATALALAIIKLKPKNVTATDYCKEILKNFQSTSTSGVQHIQIEDSENNHVDTSDHPIAVASCSTVEQNTDIFTSSREISQESSQIFDNIKRSFNANHVSNQRKDITEFEIIQTIQYIKNTLCYIIGKNPFESRPNYSQDSGYRSLQSSSEDHRRRHTELNNLNSYLSTLTQFLYNASDKTHSKEVVLLVSDVYATTLDELYRHNIYLSFYDTILDTLEDILIKLKSSDETKESNYEDILLRFTLFNKSNIIMSHSMKRLRDELEAAIDKLQKCNSSEVFELKEPDTLNYLFYIFFMIELLLKKRHEKSKTPSQDVKDTQATNYSYKDKQECVSNNVMDEEYSKLLSEVIIKYSDTYPLLAFWAMECNNLIKSFKTSSA